MLGVESRHGVPIASSPSVEPRVLRLGALPAVVVVFEAIVAVGERLEPRYRGRLPEKQPIAGNILGVRQRGAFVEL